MPVPWRALICDYTLGIGFIRKAAEETYEKAKDERLALLAQAYTRSPVWQGSEDLRPTQRLHTLLPTLPRLIMPEDIDCVGAWYPRELL